MQVPHSRDLEEELLQYQVKGTEVNTRTPELYSEQGNTDEMIQCKVCKRHNAKGKSFARGVILQELSASKTYVETSKDSLMRSGVANQGKRSGKAPQSRR